MTILEVSKIINGKVNNCSLKKKIRNIKFDSKKVKKNDLFICIKGKNKDGHDYIKEAIKNGAVAVITSRKLDNIPNIEVKDTLSALKQLAFYKRNKFLGTVIAVTGSVGKTTTKEMLSNVLKTKYNVISNEGSKNNIYGLSETIFKLKKEDILLVEFGMNHTGEIEELSKICRPSISIITNIGSSHIGNLKSKRKIYKAKIEIVKGMNKGKLIVNNDDKYLRKTKLKNIKLIKVGFSGKDIKCNDYKILNDKTEFTVKINNKLENFTLNLPGKHFVNNALLVIATSLNMGIDITDIKSSLKKFVSYDRRYKIYRKNNIILIDDSYNSSYESLKANLKTLNDKSDKLLIVGDILELGKKSKKIHKKVGKLLDIPNSTTIVVGQNMSILKNKYKHFFNSEDVIKYLKTIDLKNKTILVKGSNKIGLDKVSDYIRCQFDIK